MALPTPRTIQALSVGAGVLAAAALFVPLGIAIRPATVVVAAVTAVAFGELFLFAAATVAGILNAAGVRPDLPSAGGSPL